MLINNKSNKFLVFILCSIFIFKNNIANNIDYSCENNLNHIENLLKNYKRPITILEVTDGSENYTSQIARKFKSVCIILVLGNNYKKVVSEIKENHLHNVIVLNPNNITCHDLETLSKCEHFDVSIIHNFTKQFADDSYRAFNAFTKLGDYVFFETQKRAIEELMHTNKNITKLNSRDKKLFLLKSEKTKLELARFTQGNRQNYKPSQNYRIESDFTKKLFKKKLLNKPISWIPGINLVTFVMLRGIYPKNQVIYENINAMKENMPYHNDLMIGNMVIQGYKIKAIDFKDKRRNANMAKCIERALNVFNEKSNRLKNPALCMEQYYKRKK